MRAIQGRALGDQQLRHIGAPRVHACAALRMRRSVRSRRTKPNQILLTCCRGRAPVQGSKMSQDSANCSLHQFVNAVPRGLGNCLGSVCLACRPAVSQRVAANSQVRETACGCHEPGVHAGSGLLPPTPGLTRLFFLPIHPLQWARCVLAGDSVMTVEYLLHTVCGDKFRKYQAHHWEHDTEIHTGPIRFQRFHSTPIHPTPREDVCRACCHSDPARLRERPALALPCLRCIPTPRAALSPRAASA